MPDEKSKLLEEKEKVVKVPDYTPDEIKYLGRLQSRLEFARTQRENPHDEFDGMSYIEYWQDNEKGGNTYIEPKKNKEDTTFQSGVIRQKIFALLSSLMNLDLSPDINAFDENDIQNQQLGNALEDIITKTNEIDEDEEKKVLRTYELLKQGDVFVEELWDERYIKDKISTDKIKFDGKITGVSWITRLKRNISKPTRNIISGLGVYLGNIRQYDLRMQPYLYTVEVKDESETESIYGKWDRWENVTKRTQPSTDLLPATLYNNNWRLLDTKEGEYEIIKYQDKWNNEFAVIINGVLMTPVGLPFPWGYNEYNISQQHYEPIGINFAYGKSLTRKLKGKDSVYTEMLRLAILKTQKSFMPARANLSGRVISSKIFMPGKMTSGIEPGRVPPLDPNDAIGPTMPEFNMIQEMKNQIDQDSVNPTFQGQAQKGTTTATEILEMQRQAKLVLGMTVLSTSLLEYKLSWLRLYNILKNWFEPINDKVVEEETRQVLKAKYRTINISKSIEGEGIGRSIIKASETIPSGQEIYDKEEQLKEQTGYPTRITYLNPQEIISSKWVWQITIRPREKKTSEVNKLLFRGMLADAMVFQQDLNLEYLEERFALNWEEDPSRLFKKGINASMMKTTASSPMMAPPTSGLKPLEAPVNANFKKMAGI